MREHGEDLRVDAVGLARQRGQPLDLLRVRDQRLPPELLKRVAHEARSRHRLDHAAHTPLRADALDEPPEATSVRRGGQAADDLAVVADQADVQAPATEI